MRRNLSCHLVSSLVLLSGWTLLSAGPAPARQAEPMPATTAEEEEEELVDYSNTGYIDDATIASRVRVRVDGASGSDRPDRAEFFYAKCGCFRNAGLELGDFFDLSAPGPVPGPNSLPSFDADYQELEIAVEHAFYDSRVSIFAELPLRRVALVDLLGNRRSFNGLSDLRVGAKLGLVGSPGRRLTLQLRAYLPTGEPSEGLGTEHASLEPGLLLLKRLSRRLTLAGELKYWVPVGGSTAVGASSDRSDEFSGEILRYGVGMSYNAASGSGLEWAPVAELVGWSVLGGFKTQLPEVAASADGDEILNLKLGVRIRGGFAGSLYVGYGLALSDDVWYDDIVRVEYRLAL